MLSYFLFTLLFTQPPLANVVQLLQAHGQVTPFDSIRVAQPNFLSSLSIDRVLPRHEGRGCSAQVPLTTTLLQTERTVIAERATPLPDSSRWGSKLRVVKSLTGDLAPGTTIDVPEVEDYAVFSRNNPDWAPFGDRVILCLRHRPHGDENPEVGSHQLAIGGLRMVLRDRVYQLKPSVQTEPAALGFGPEDLLRRSDEVTRLSLPEFEAELAKAAEQVRFFYKHIEEVDLEPHTAALLDLIGPPPGRIFEPLRRDNAQLQTNPMAAEIVAAFVDRGLESAALEGIARARAARVRIHLGQCNRHINDESAERFLEIARDKQHQLHHRTAALWLFDYVSMNRSGRHLDRLVELLSAEETAVQRAAARLLITMTEARINNTMSIGVGPTKLLSALRDAAATQSAGEIRTALQEVADRLDAQTNRTASR